MPQLTKTFYIKVIVSSEILHAAERHAVFKKVLESLPPDGEIKTIDLQSFIAKSDMSLNMILQILSIINDEYL